MIPSPSHSASPQLHPMARRLQTLQAERPREFRLQTGRALTILAAHHDGLTTEGFLCQLYPRYHHVSRLQKDSLGRCMNKLVQRLRGRIAAYGVVVHFDSGNRTWSLRVDPQF